MRIGVPDEIKDGETRVGLTPDNVETLVGDGHEVLIEEGAGEDAGFEDELYDDAGADIVDQEEAWDVDLGVKIKEPLQDEYEFLDEDTTLFTYFHLAADEELTEEILDSGMTAIAYETVEDDGDLPLLEPMSQVAGRMASIMGAHYQAQPYGGGGVLPPGIDDVDPADVTVVGGGTVGANATEVAAGMGADVTVLDIDEDRLEELDEYMPENVTTKESTPANIEEELYDTDILVGAVLVSGAEAPTVVTEGQVEDMQDGSVIVDVAIDQGGCIETTTDATSHEEPIDQDHLKEYGVSLYAVDNMPAAYPKTATEGITEATMPYIREIAEKGWKDAMAEDEALKKGLNAVDGELTYDAVAEAFDIDYTEPQDLYEELA